MSKMRISIKELIERFENEYGYEPTTDELLDAYFSGKLDQN